MLWFLHFTALRADIGEGIWQSHISTRTSPMNLRVPTQDVGKLVGGDELRIVRTAIDTLQLQNQGQLDLKSALANNREVSEKPTQFTK